MHIMKYPLFHAIVWPVKMIFTGNIGLIKTKQQRGPISGIYM